MLFAESLGLVMGLVLLLWLLSLALRDASVVDIFWGLGFVAIAWFSGLLSDADTWRKWLVVALTTVWGLRLAGYLAWRNLGKGEDFRYQAMRDKHQSNFWWVSLLTVFGLQGVVMWIVSFPIQSSTQATNPLGLLDLGGVLLWCIGLAFEAIGDLQLAIFKSDSKHQGQVLDRGLWRYTRHPNYFGDFLVWWGLFLLAAGGGGWWTIVSPLLMSLLLMKVSGVTLLEKTLVKSRPGYQEYADRTNAFFPGPPKQL